MPLFYNRNIFLYLLNDRLAYCIILLRIWVVGLMYLSSESIYGFNINKKIFHLLLLFLLIFLLMSFYVNRILLFYVFFEISLIPTFF